MTVKEAIQISHDNPKKDIHVMVDARDVIEMLEMIESSMIPENEKVGHAIYELNEMNVDIPYRMNIINDAGNIETFIPE